MELQENLNPQQLEAVEHVEGPMLVIAGAGSGKTRIVTYRILHLLDIGVPSSAIVAVTFTNKAAKEMQDRIHKFSKKDILTSTFHSLCARILRSSIAPLGYRNHFTIFDEEDSEKVLKTCLQEKHLKEEKGFLKNVRYAISHAKNTLIDPEILLKEDALIGELYLSYQNKLKQYNALDFDDLLYLTVKLFKQDLSTLEYYQNIWNFILIDEYQDTNHAQYMLIKLLSEKHRNVFAVGDPDQSIYSWRGANVQNILDFDKDYPGAKVIKLEQNYRSTPNILKAANCLIEENQSRYEKKLWSLRVEGQKVGFCLSPTDYDEVSFVLERIYYHHYRQNIPLSQCAIFYRTHFQSRIFEDALLKENIPYIIVGGISFYMRREIKDLLAFLRVAHEGADFLSFSRIINLPKRGIGHAMQAKIRVLAEEKKNDLILTCQDILIGNISLSLSHKQQQGLRHFLEIIEAIRTKMHEMVSIHDLLEIALEQSKYLDYLDEDPLTKEERTENIEELFSKAIEWKKQNEEASLANFLEEMTLKTSQDETHLSDAVRLMTLHNGKGLEFTTCFLVGMEEELFPHINALGNIEDLEEERRLCYVGMTRACDFLYLTAAKTRHLWGSLKPMIPSRFLSEISPEYLEKFHEDFSLPYSSTITENFQEGDIVTHRDFGRGKINKTYQTSLGLTVDVFFFETKQTRSLVTKYAKLTRI